MADKPTGRLRNFGLAPRSRTDADAASAGFVGLGGGAFDVLTRHWWVLGLRGLFGIGFGIAAILLPAVTLTSLVILFAAYMIVDGLAALMSAALMRRHEHWIALSIEGVLGLLVAGVMLAWPALTVIIAVYAIGFWAILSGVALLVASARFGGESWTMAVASIASILFGCLLLFSPLSGAVVIALWLGIYAIIFGVALLGLAWKLRHQRHDRSRDFA